MKKKLLKSVKKQRNYALIKNAKIVMFCGPEVIWGKVQYRIWNPHRIFKSKEKNYSNRSRNNEIML
ncbi:MAG: hypothetical protein GY739_03600 [Mesoflavibacter sp.]|nr:hypothetical protein [Mesoflavibacter sp.]